MVDSPLFTLQNTDQWPCPCGCGRSFPRHTGMLHYSASGEAVYRAHLLEETKGEPHLWLLLGTGSWLEDEPLGSWIAVHSWTNNEQITARVEDPEKSPFSQEDAFGERLLTREEVFAQEGGNEWVFRCHDLIVENHPEVSSFLGLAPNNSFKPKPLRGSA